MSACEKTMTTMLLLSTTSLFQVGRWKSRSALLEREVPKRSDGSAPPGLEVMNRSRPKSKPPFNNKAYRPNAHLLYIVMPYNGSII